MSAVPRPVTLFLCLMVLLLAAYPLYADMVFGDQAQFYLQKLTTIIIFAIFAMSLDLLVGVTGLVSMGHALFFGVAGYALGLLSPEYEAANIWIVLPATLAICAVVGLVVGVLCVRTSGVYFIMATLAFGQMGFYFFNDSSFAGGSDGMYIMMKPEVAIAGIQLIDLETREGMFYLALGAMVAVYLILRMLIRAPFGRVLVGIHANEHRVRALGYNAVVYKIWCFVIASVLAGLAGFLGATQYGFVNPSQLGWHSSGYALMTVILGGTGTIFGAILGAFTFEILHHVFESLTDHWSTLMGCVMIGVVLFLPAGLSGLALRVFAERRTGDKATQVADAAVQGEEDPRAETPPRSTGEATHV
ncbi:branched-chain amino acid ABC transporter permease [Rhodospirillum sp. A1_3_36]|uniref:branched-chain amino acid ABC transporter permease n=1 Tax=Rhodospirillum sp. A1_3_36 TaxID=3391666 RepID=UPI0039A75D91